MTYAEDYYSGGDLREADLKLMKPSPSSLTPARAAMLSAKTGEAHCFLTALNMC